jgi:hypothetical protein
VFTVSLFVIANKLTTSANAVFLQFTAPVYVILISYFILKEKIDEMFRKETKNSQFYTLASSKKRIFSRKYAIIDLTPSDTGQKFTYEYINFMQKKYPNYILFVINKLRIRFLYKIINQIK